MKLLNGFGTDPAYYIVPSYSIVKGKRNFCSTEVSRCCLPLSLLLWQSPVQLPQWRWRTLRLYPQLQTEDLDPKLLLFSLLPQWRMENGEGSQSPESTLPGMRGVGLPTVAHWRWRTAMENGEEKTERCRVTSV